jgi:hypothetical protein
MDGEDKLWIGLLIIMLVVGLMTGPSFSARDCHTDTDCMVIYGGDGGPQSASDALLEEIDRYDWWELVGYYDFEMMVRDRAQYVCYPND